MSRTDRFRYRTRYFTDSGIIGTREFVRNHFELNTGDKIEFIVMETREALIRPISKKVDEVFGRLHKPERRAVSVEEMNAIIKNRFKAGKK